MEKEARKKLSVEDLEGICGNLEKEMLGKELERRWMDLKMNGDTRFVQEVNRLLSEQPLLEEERNEMVEEALEFASTIMCKDYEKKPEYEYEDFGEENVEESVPEEGSVAEEGSVPEEGSAPEEGSVPEEGSTPEEGSVPEEASVHPESLPERDDESAPEGEAKKDHGNAIEEVEVKLREEGEAEEGRKTSFQ